MNQELTEIRNQVANMLHQLTTIDSRLEAMAVILKNDGLRNAEPCIKGQAERLIEEEFLGKALIKEYGIPKLSQRMRLDNLKMPEGNEDRIRAVVAWALSHQPWEQLKAKYIGSN